MQNLICKPSLLLFHDSQAWSEVIKTLCAFDTSPPGNRCRTLSRPSCELTWPDTREIKHDTKQLKTRFRCMHIRSSRNGRVCKAHGLVYHSTMESRVENEKKKRKWNEPRRTRRRAGTWESFPKPARSAWWCRCIARLYLQKRRIFIELMTSDHKLKASREGSKWRIYRTSRTLQTRQAPITPPENSQVRSFHKYHLELQIGIRLIALAPSPKMVDFSLM